MNSKEIEKQLEMSYDELVEYLLGKYGPARYDYFCNELCKSKNRKVARTSEGLFCHHIDENKAILLSSDKCAIKYPFEYQKANHLVYCNVLEHLILHIKIVEDNSDNNCFSAQGIGGAACCICPQINDYFNGYQFKQQHLIKIYDQIKNNFVDYIDILKYFLSLLQDRPLLSNLITKEKLSLGWDGQIIKKIYDLL